MESLYTQLLKELKSSKIDYDRVEKLLRRIGKELERGNFPSEKEYSVFLEALEVIEVKHAVLAERIKEFYRRKKVNEVYGKNS